MSNIKTVYADTLDPEKTIKIELYYSMGGTQYFTLNTKIERGYYIAIKVVKLEKRDGYTSEQYLLLGNGYRKLLISCSRKSKGVEAKALELFKAEWLPMLLEFGQAQGLTLVKREDGALPCAVGLV
jgi:hypothetical protein